MSNNSDHLSLDQGASAFVLRVEEEVSALSEIARVMVSGLKREVAMMSSDPEGARRFVLGQMPPLYEGDGSVMGIWYHCYGKAISEQFGQLLLPKLKPDIRDSLN